MTTKYRDRQKRGYFWRNLCSDEDYPQNEGN